MDQKLPFSSYDFWAYLAAGFLFLAALDQVMDSRLLMRDSWTVVQSVIAVSLAYVVGQVMAGGAAWLFERMLVGRLLGFPRDILFGDVRAARIVQRMLPGYFEPLSPRTQAAVRNRANDSALTPGEMFLPALSHARGIPSVATRLDNFLNLYGFCRNVAFVAFLDAALLYWSYYQPGGPNQHLVWSRYAFILGIAMTLRYLKFYRHFATEVFTTWAYPVEKK